MSVLREDHPNRTPALEEEETWDVFISYRRVDARLIAVWLKDRLGRYRLPAEIQEELPPESAALHARRPRVFLDVAYEKSSYDFLERKIYPALDRSSRLIVISSPAALELIRSPSGEMRDNWLCLEVDRYLGSASATNPSRPIDVVLAPGASEHQFPGRLAENQHWDWIDLRHFTRWRSLGLGEHLDEAWLKLVASVYDVPERMLPLLMGEERRRRNRILLWATVTAVAIAILMAVLAIVAVDGRVKANKASAQAQSFLMTSEHRLSNALATAAGTAISTGNELVAALLLAEARQTAATPLEVAQTLAFEKPHAAFQRTLAHGDDDGAWALAFQPRTGNLAVGFYDGTVRLFGATRTRASVLLKATGPPVIDLAFTPDGSSLFVLRRAPADGAWNPLTEVKNESEIYRLDMSSGTLPPKVLRIASTSKSPHFLALAVTVSKEALLVGTDSGVLLLPVDGGEVTILEEQEEEQASSVALSADCRWAAASTIRGHIRVWDLASRKQTASFRVPLPEGTFEYNPFHLAFAPGGDELAFGSFDGILYLWQVGKTRNPTRQIAAHLGAVASVAWSPDGRRLASGGYDGTTALVDWGSGEVITRLPTTGSGLTAGTLRVAFSADGRSIATSEGIPVSSNPGGNWLYGTVRVWSLGERPVPAVSVSGISSTPKGTMVVWDAEKQELGMPEVEVLATPCAAGRPWTTLHEARTHRSPVAFLEAAQSQSWDALGRVAKPTGPAGEMLVGPSALHPDGRRVGFLTGRSSPSEDGLVDLRFVLCQAGDPTPVLKIPIPTDPASTLAPIVFDRSGSRALVAVGERNSSESGTLRTEIFAVGTDSSTLQKLGTWDSHAVASVALTGDGRYAALSDDFGELAILDTKVGALLPLPRWLSGAPLRLTFDPADRRLVAAGDVQLRVFDFVNGTAVNERRAVTSTRFRPTALTVSPAESVLVVGEADGSISFWNLETLEQLLHIETDVGPVLALKASADGKALAILGLEGLEFRGGFLPGSVTLTERLTRLHVAGSVPVPLASEAEQSVVEEFPEATWKLVPDPAAAVFWRLVAEGGVRRIEPHSWWDWLFWSGPVELSSDLELWLNEHHAHPLANVINNLAFDHEADR